MTIVDPEAPGRGPERIGALYRWERAGDLPILGVFAGFVRGTRKGADTLLVRIASKTCIPIRYEHLVKAYELDTCPECEQRLFLRVDKDVWHCENCGHHEEPTVEILHRSEWECDECGGPSPATSMQGCRYCGGQGDIVPRGTARVRTWKPKQS